MSDSILLSRLGLETATGLLNPDDGESASECRARLLALINSVTPFGVQSSTLPDTTSSAVEEAVRRLVLDVSFELDEVRPNAEFARQRLDEVLMMVGSSGC